MKKFASILVATAIALSLSGCSLLYPNWGTDQKPDTSQSAAPSESASETPSASPTAVNKLKATLRIDDASADATAGVISVIAQVTNVAQDGGTCTLVLQVGNQTKRLAFKAEANVNTTQCHPMEIPLAGLPKGTALVSVEYESKDYFGVSPAQSVVIP
jgi:PBP1b-binding outer membrane lipoprotein LpoB